jgi:dephospho-CoA kinase
MMLKIGLTGNIGSGKSLVAKIFSVLGAPVYHADSESKKFLEFPSVRSEIERTFTDQVILPDGTVDRKMLATLVFSDPEKLKRLNALLHPLVIKDFSEWCLTQTSHPYIIHEAAIILESGLKNEFDKIVHVSCPADLAIERAMVRDKITREEVLKRMHFQYGDEKKAAMSDYIILNDGSVLVIPQVLELHGKFSKGSS